MGTRLGQPNEPKALKNILNKPLIYWAMENFIGSSSDIVIVVQSKFESMFKNFIDQYKINSARLVFQDEPNGTAQAVKIGLNSAKNDWVVVLWGDHIGANWASIESLLTKLNNSKIDFYLPIVLRKHPYVYFTENYNMQTTIFNETRFGAKIPEEGYSDCGYFLFRKNKISEFLNKFITSENLNLKEVNFLSLFNQMALTEDINFETVLFSELNLTIGVNTIEEVNIAEAKLMLRGNYGKKI
jgi:bifunctional N-acetylglucosamine-1-phosphate-uridyltransferase/glucosamine-1-phosphate-acetyltransferase GlmU-like protein